MQRSPLGRKEFLQLELINTRQMTSLIDREMALGTKDIKRETVNWVPMWVDWGHSVRSDCATATAIRAITDQGELLWYVRNDTKKHGYHSLHTDPFEAIQEALDAWQKRRQVRAEWHDVKQLARDLIAGRTKLTVTIEDAQASALCTIGIKWFRRKFRLNNRSAVSGRTAALLMKLEPQLGFVIYEAAQRQNVWALHTGRPATAFSTPGE